VYAVIQIRAISGKRIAQEALQNTHAQGAARELFVQPPSRFVSFVLFVA
jgi:hypothetical protein